MAKLEFSRTHSYPSTVAGISMPVVLKCGDDAVHLLGYLDTGASHCLFERRHGELLRLDIEAGDRRAFGTATGSVVAFGHVVQLEILGLTFESTVYFFADEGIRKNLLGRTGWLDRVRLGLVHYDCEMLVASYDS
jgi:hypothetical protein